MQSIASLAAVGPVGGELLAKDPLLHDLESYGEFRRRNSLKLRQRYRETLTQAATLEPSVAPFCQYLKQAITELESVSEMNEGIDPYFNTVLRVWMNGLDQGLDWIQRGADPACLKHFADLRAAEKDLALEYPQTETAGSRLMRVIDGSIRLIPVDKIAASPRLQARVRQCLPGFPDADLYQPLGEAEMDLLQEHLTHSLEHIKALDRVGYLGLKRNIQTIYVTLIKSKKKSFGSRYDCPGSLIAGFPERRLRQRDTYVTASQFYHEHCHTKLSLYSEVMKIDFTRDDNYISSFKNENRDIESVLHTIYPITMECIIRLALLPSYEEWMRQRAIAYLAAVGFRLRLMVEVFRSDPLSASSSEFEKIRELSELVLDLIEAEIQKCPAKIRAAHRREHKRVMERHAWDIGQFLCRGLAVKDPGLSEVKCSEGRAEFTFRGKRYTASLRAARDSQSSYGSYIESLL